MEQTITQKQLITLEQVENIARWQEEEAFLLARHFQRLNEKRTSKALEIPAKIPYYTRTNYFEMKPTDVDALNKLTGIKGIRIYLSLEEEEKTAFTFCPIINIKCDNSEERWFNLEARYQEPLTPLNPIPSANITGGGTIVPGIFKDMIVANWNSVENNLIDDLFVAKDERTKLLRRVNFFDVSSDTVLELFNNTLQGNISRFILYPGVDMNKFQHRDMISFTPVIGIIPKTRIKTDIMSRHGILEFSENEIFIEYSKPCPPTCPPNSN